ncbi:MAG: hypothetical protein KBF82_09740 [Chitinophagaceae bacterium]|nr:hypothetical protein [Chitinophagaceae bacterium]
MKITLLLCTAILFSNNNTFSQDCKTNADLDAVPGKYLTAAQYPWPAVRAEYFNNLATSADKAIAKLTLSQLEKIEAQSHTGFSLTGGNWENTYSSKGYSYLGNTKLGAYTFQAALYEYFCNNGKMKRNSEYSTVLRIYANAIPIKTLDPLLQNPFGSSMGDYDLGLQFMDWKNHKPADVNAQLIPLFTYMSCTSQSLIDAINTGSNYFQDVDTKDIKPNNRNIYITRYWFIKKKNLPVLIPVSRNEYLLSLLEYYDREKIYFRKLVAKLTEEHNNDIKQYTNWEADIADKIAVVKKALSDHNEGWLSAQAVINRTEDAALNYKAKLTERTNYKRFWDFSGTGNKSEPLYKYNPEYFKTIAQGPAKPQIVSIAFRYVTIASSLRMLDNVTNNFNFDAIKKMLE